VHVERGGRARKGQKAYEERCGNKGSDQEVKLGKGGSAKEIVRGGRRKFVGSTGKIHGKGAPRV